MMSLLKLKGFHFNVCHGEWPTVGPQGLGFIYHDINPPSRSWLKQVLINPLKRGWIHSCWFKINCVPTFRALSGIGPQKFASEKDGAFDVKQ